MRSFPTLLLTVTLALTGAVGAASTAAPAPADRSDPDDPRTWQTSDQVPGRIAPDVPAYQRGTDDFKRIWWYDAAPGVRVSKWAHLSPRGRVRYFLVRAWFNKPGLKVDYAHAPKVKQTEPLGRMLRRTKNVVAGINGDFFDIGDTGAPLGLGRARGEGLVHGIDFGWNSAFWFSEKGIPKVDLLHMKAEIRGHDLPITNYNSPQVKPNGIGLYTPRWGEASGNRWVDGDTRYARVVHVKNRKVVSNKTTFPRGEFTGYYLVARGDRKRRQLRALEVGETVRVRRYLPEPTTMAITGNAILLQNGQRMVDDDGEMHPRTAVGIDRDTKQIIFLVVDGRARQSRGYTMVETARLMKQQLGAEDALNLDGGGSSTMVAKKDGSLGVVNVPSDGTQRAIPNGLQITYSKPQGRR